MGKLFNVKGIIEVPRIDPQGEVLKVHKVTAVTMSGDRFTVEIPEAEFTEAKVAEIVGARAAELEAIRKL